MRHAVVFVLFCAAMAAASFAQTFTTLVNFNGSNGNTPYLMALVQGVDGNFYGTTQFGGTTGHGVVFKMTPSGTVTVLYSFSGGNDGEYPAAGLVQGTDGNFARIYLQQLDWMRSGERQLLLGHNEQREKRHCRVHLRQQHHP